MQNEKISNIVEKCKKDNIEYLLVRNWHQPTPFQVEFRELFDTEKSVGRTSIKNKILKNEFKFFLDECLEAYPIIDYEYYLMESRTFRNMDKNSGTEFHVDESDVLHWQCRGATQWIIGKNKDSFMLEPGDLLWFRANTEHSTENITEKYSLIFLAGLPISYVSRGTV